ncbi:MAG: hypothetical protein KAI83_12590 [Thiomargarita sp.]|nr:hypothetical protein [Thiomargarita sp.]
MSVLCIVSLHAHHFSFDTKPGRVSKRGVHRHPTMFERFAVAPKLPTLHSDFRLEWSHFFNF